MYFARKIMDLAWAMLRLTINATVFYAVDYSFRGREFMRSLVARQEVTHAPAYANQGL